MEQGFLKKLIDYDKEGIQQDLIDQIQPFIRQDKFQIDHLKSVS